MATATILPESINDPESVKEIAKLANEYGTEFVNVFYKTFDNKRQVFLRCEQKKQSLTMSKF